MSNKSYKEIPSVQEILQEIGKDIQVHQNHIVKLIRKEIGIFRELAKNSNLNSTRREISNNILKTVSSFSMLVTDISPW